MKTKLKSIFAAIFTLLVATEANAMRWYCSNTARWLSRDQIGERSDRITFRRSVESGNLYRLKDPVNFVDVIGNIEVSAPIRLRDSVIISHPNGRPDWGILVRSKKVEIPRCTYLILLGHASVLPSEMMVTPVNSGCAFGQAYGCGGIATNIALPGQRTYPDFVEVPPVISPGILGAPNQPTSLTGDREMVNLGESAFLAALTQASSGKLCKLPCCCFSITVKIQCPGPIEFDDTREGRELEARYRALCGKEVIINCRRASLR